MPKTWLCLQYTLTETHVGAAGTVGATDLPIAREAATFFPYLPDTALKGVARDAAEERFKTVGREKVDDLFGWIREKPYDKGGKGARDARGTDNSDRAPVSGPQPGVGGLSFTQGHLLLYPLRSLERPFVYATCALQLARLARLTEAYGLTDLSNSTWADLRRDSGKARCGKNSGFPGQLVVEHLAYGASELEKSSAVDNLAMLLASWLERGALAARDVAEALPTQLVVLPDQDFAALVRETAPIRARVSLNDRKTTTGDGGNLWYEEMLPSDCLFWSILSLKDGAGDPRDVETVLADLRHTQIGAGESTGHGRCWWWSAVEGK